MQKYPAPRRPPGTLTWHPEGWVLGCPIVPPPSRERAEEGARPAARLPRRLDGAGEQSWHRGKQLNLARFPASSELRLWAPAGRGATVSAVHLSSGFAARPPPAPLLQPHRRLLPPSQLGRGVRPLWDQGRWGGRGGLHPRWTMPLGLGVPGHGGEHAPHSRAAAATQICGRRRGSLHGEMVSCRGRRLQGKMVSAGEMVLAGEMVSCNSGNRHPTPAHFEGTVTRYRAEG